MHILYLDDSGSAANAQDEYVILAGLAVFERQAHWFSKELENLANSIWPDNPHNLEFRGTDILTGKRHWRGVGKDDRAKAYQNALQVIARNKHARLFGAAVHKASVSPNDPMEYAFEQICNRFDRFLGRLHKSGDTQRGIVVLDESSYETSMQSLAKEFGTKGHTWGQIYNFAEVPLFVNSRATRLIQYADLVAHATRRKFEQGDNSLFDIFAHKFDSVGGVVHGLYHCKPPDVECVCPFCRQRRSTLPA